MGSHTSVSPPPFAYWVNALSLTPVVLANLCIYPDICFGFLSPFKNTSGYRAFPCTQALLAEVLTFCLVLTVLSMKAELSYLDPPTIQEGSAIYHLKPQFHPSLDFYYSLMPKDSFGCVPTQQIKSPWIAIPAGIKPKFIKHLWTLYVGLQENSLMKSPNSWPRFLFNSNCFFHHPQPSLLLQSQCALFFYTFPFMILQIPTNLVVIFSIVVHGSWKMLWNIKQFIFKFAFVGLLIKHNYIDLKW